MFTKKIITSFKFLNRKDKVAVGCVHFRIFLGLVSGEGTTLLEYPRIYKAEQHLFIVMMKAFKLSILLRCDSVPHR